MTNPKRTDGVHATNDSAAIRSRPLGTIANPAKVLNIEQRFEQRHCTACGHQTPHLVTTVHTSLGQQDIVRCFDTACPESR